jgi:hypothetical protein
MICRAILSRLPSCDTARAQSRPSSCSARVDLLRDALLSNAQIRGRCPVGLHRVPLDRCRSAMRNRIMLGDPPPPRGPSRLPQSPLEKGLRGSGSPVKPERDRELVFSARVSAFGGGSVPPPPDPPRSPPSGGLAGFVPEPGFVCRWLLRSDFLRIPGRGYHRVGACFHCSSAAPQFQFRPRWSCRPRF